MLGGPSEGNVLLLSGLPELRSLSLIGDLDVPCNPHIDSSSFQGAPQLQCLRIHWDKKLQLHPGTLAQLTGLTSLILIGCGLRSMPADVALLRASLCELDFRSNSIQVDGADVTSIPQCAKLSKLHLERSGVDCWEHEVGADPDDNVWQFVKEQLDREGYVPARFSESSVMHLMQLPLAFH